MALGLNLQDPASTFDMVPGIGSRMCIEGGGAQSPVYS